MFTNLLPSCSAKCRFPFSTSPLLSVPVLCCPLERSALEVIRRNNPTTGSMEVPTTLHSRPEPRSGSAPSRKQSKQLQLLPESNHLGWIYWILTFPFQNPFPSQPRKPRVMLKEVWQAPDQLRFGLTSMGIGILVANGCVHISKACISAWDGWMDGTPTIAWHWIFHCGDQSSILQRTMLKTL